MVKNMLRFVGVGVVALMVSASAAVSHERKAQTDRCPRGNVKQVDDVNAVVGAARRLLIRGKSISVRGTNYPLTNQNAPILQVVSLSPRFTGVPGVAGFRDTAARRCGAQIASASWTVIVFYKLAAAATSSVGRAFIVLTDRGWRVYS